MLHEVLLHLASVLMRYMSMPGASGIQATVHGQNLHGTAVVELLATTTKLDKHRKCNDVFADLLPDGSVSTKPHMQYAHIHGHAL